MFFFIEFYWEMLFLWNSIGTCCFYGILLGHVVFMEFYWDMLFNHGYMFCKLGIGFFL